MPTRTGQPGLFGPIEPTRPHHPRTKRSAKEAGQSWVLAEKARLVRLALESAGDNLYDYAVPDSLAEQICLGQRVRVPFGRGARSEVGFCVDFPDSAEVDRVKLVSEIVDAVPLINPEMLELAAWMGQYYCCPLGVVLSAMVPAAVKHRVGMTKRTYVRLKQPIAPDSPDHRLSRQGRAIIDYLRNHPRDDRTDLKELAAGLNCGRAPFRTLVRAGLIELIERRELDSSEALTSPRTVDPQPIALNPDQTAVLKAIRELIAEHTFNAILLHGVTGSGKTEIYIRAVDDVLRAGRTALVLIPEIALTPQTVSRFKARFGEVAVMHSQLTPRQRHQQWQLIAQGQARLVVGARSAVFAPLANLGIIVIDEEHEPSYKQDNSPRYHGRNVAIKRAQMNNIPIILGSATPSLETYYNCQTKSHYHLLPLPQRVLDLPLPRVRIVNLQTEAFERKGGHLFSRALEHELGRCLAAGRQAIILLNRRGHSSYLFCPSCQFVLKCPNCDVSLTLHRRKETPDERRHWVMCHHCQHRSLLPEQCPLCAKKLLRLGPGTQKAEDELARKMPQARVRRVDSDSMSGGNYEAVLAEFERGEIDVLLGTQMIGKGLDFPNVALVGVLNADTALSLPDFRSSERTFQLITQVAGRCGRADAAGEVIVQTFLPDDPAIELACKHDYESFVKQELLLRQRCHLPPYWRLARMVLSHGKLEKLEQAARQVRRQIDQIREMLGVDVTIRGPLPAPLAYLENYHRQEIMFSANSPVPIQRLLGKIRQSILGSLNVRATLDIDPVNLM